MKNIVWVILGIVVFAVILFVIKKDGNKMGDAEPQKDTMENEAAVKLDQVFVNDAGQELMVNSTPKSAKISFSAIGNVTLNGYPTVSGIEYRSADGKLVFWATETSAVLTKDGVVIFEGNLQGKK